MTLSSVGWCEMEMNWLSEPRLEVFRSWKSLEVELLQVPTVIPVWPVRVR